MAFSKNVFINCPFDDDFLPLLRPILFTVIYLKFKPRIAVERMDSGEPRISKIIELIADSQFAIHDLSRIKAKKAGELFRFNMPFELGIDVGCRLFKGGARSTKKCLILEAQRYRYQAALSDLSNSDIGVHSNKPEKAAAEIRNWLNTQCRLKAPGPAKIWGAFNDFMGDNYDRLSARGFSPKNIEMLAIPELIECMEEWTEDNA